MAWTTIPQALINVGKAITQTLMQYIKDDLDHLYGQIGTLASGLQNGSFEIDSDSDGIPDSWTRYLYPGGSGAYETTSPAHGTKAYKFTHPGGAGNGGGYLESDYVACSPYLVECLDFIHWASPAGMKNQVYVRYYDKAKVYVSQTLIYSSTANPTTATLFQYQHTPPATARFYKVRVEGGYTDTDQIGSAYFDGIQTGPARTRLLRSLTTTAPDPGTSYSDVAGLGFTLAPYTAYEFEYRLRWYTNSATGNHISLNGPATAAVLQYSISAIVLGTGSSNLFETKQAYDSDLMRTPEGGAAIGLTGSKNYLITIRGIIRTGAAGGTIIPRGKADAAAGVDWTCYADSIGKLTQLP